MNRKDRRKVTKKVKSKSPQKAEPILIDNSIVGKIKTFYEEKYKLLLIIPILLFVFSVAVILFQISSTGSFINKGISLSGGVSLEYNTEVIVPIEILQSQLSSEFPNDEIIVRSLGSAEGFSTVIEMSLDINNIDFKEVSDKITGIIYDYDNSVTLINTEIIGAVLGESFFKTAFRSVIIAFILMGIVVFIYFKNPSPSLAVIAAAVADIVETVAIVNLLGMRVSSAGIAAFLMLIGYSVDTDILLTSRVLKRTEGSVMDRVYSSFKTGILMTLTTLSALTVGIIFAKSVVLRQIMIIVLIGLLLDIVNTWIQNVGILRWYIEKKGDKIKRPKVVKEDEFVNEV